MSEISDDRKRFTFYLTGHQKETLGRFANRKLSSQIVDATELPPRPFARLPKENEDEVANQNVGGYLTTTNYLKLKQLASDAGISMSKAAIRLLQLPE